MVVVCDLCGTDCHVLRIPIDITAAEFRAAPYVLMPTCWAGVNRDRVETGYDYSAAIGNR